MSRPQVHGMGRVPVDPDWPPLRPDEVGAVLGAYPAAAGRDATVIWRSPRPFSAAALVHLGGTAVPAPEVVFVKRHHRSVRAVGDLGVEHRFSDHLRAGGIPVPEVLRTARGEGATARGEWTYEVQVAGTGDDRYRDATSWTPYTCVGHASAAGRQLASFHRVAAGFVAPPRGPGLLRSGDRIATAADPVTAVEVLASTRPILADYLNERSWAGELREAVGPLADDLAATVRSVGRPLPQWGHGDWHGSNLLWSGGDVTPAVSSVLDLGLAERMSAVGDVAVALERSCVGWLDLAEGGHPAVDVAGALALVAAYDETAAPGALDRAVLAGLLPLIHLDFALSEVEYFHGLLRQPSLADLAWEGYVIGHLAWWRTPAGRELPAALRSGRRLSVP